jgi:hypothetical protein
MYGSLGAGVGMAALLFATSYTFLRSTGATDFGEASLVRGEAFADAPLPGNVNGMALVAAQGLIAAVVLALNGRTASRRYLCLGCGALCCVATFLPMSRGGITIAVVSCVAILLAARQRPRAIVTAGVLSAAIVLWVPDVVFQRLEFTTADQEREEMEGRARVYTASVESLPEYLVAGIGSGNFWHSWGASRGFDTPFGVIGSHNSFLQVTIYWGLAGLAALLWLVWRVRLCLPRRYGGDELALWLLGLAVSLLLWMQAVHNLYDKTFAIGLGLIVGSHHWVWPSRAPAVGLQKSLLDRRRARGARRHNFPVLARG